MTGSLTLACSICMAEVYSTRYIGATYTEHMLNTAETEFAQELAARVRNLRTPPRLSQQELSVDNAELTRSVVANLERGVKLPRPSTIRKIALAFDIPLSELTTGE